jgi:hypothetical protein
VRQKHVIGVWQEEAPMRRHVLVPAVSLAVLLIVAFWIASCGPDAATDPYITSPALGLAASGCLPVVQQLGDAIISYLSGKSDLAALQKLVTIPEAQDGLGEMLSSLAHPSTYRVLGETAYMVNNDVFVDLLFLGGTSTTNEFSIRILVDPHGESTTITGIKPGPSGFR